MRSACMSCAFSRQTVKPKCCPRPQPGNTPGEANRIRRALPFYCPWAGRSPSCPAMQPMRPQSQNTARRHQPAATRALHRTGRIASERTFARTAWMKKADRQRIGEWRAFTQRLCTPTSPLAMCQHRRAAQQTRPAADAQSSATPVARFDAPAWPNKPRSGRYHLHLPPGNPTGTSGGPGSCAGRVGRPLTNSRS